MKLNFNPYGWFQNSRTKNEKIYLAKCGHETKESDTVSAFNESITTKLPIKDDEVKHCHKCLEKMAKKCAWCGRPIFIGDPVTLYSPADKNFKIPDFALIFSKDPLRLVGCPRKDCAKDLADYSGRLEPPGLVFCHPSVIEKFFSSAKM